jgi:SAM-dependent methyltransferase
MAVLGSGHGHDALWFAEHGFEVVGFDFASSAIEIATATARLRGLSAQFLQRDIFALPEEFSHDFDYVLEHTCYCAILPEQRADYVRVVRSILRPQGELIGLFWAHDRPSGPPFGTSSDEILQHFMPNFKVISILQPTNSIETRKDEEYLVRFRVQQ